MYDVSYRARRPTSLPTRFHHETDGPVESSEQSAVENSIQKLLCLRVFAAMETPDRAVAAEGRHNKLSETRQSFGSS